MLTDLRLAIRNVGRRPAFALTCVAVLAIGLGASMAIFSVLYSAVLKDLPYPHPGQLVAVHNRYPQVHLNRIGTSPFDYSDLSAHRELFSDAGVYYFLDLSRTGVDRPRKVNAVAFTASLFRTLGVTPLLGRTFNTSEEQFHGPHAVILSEGYWQREFARDPGILNRDIQLDGNLYRIVGVMPQAFQFPNKVTEMWVPVTFKPGAAKRGATQPHFLRMYARLAPGLNFEGAASRIEQLSIQLGKQYPEDYPVERMGWRYFVLPMAKDDDGSLRRWLYILFGAAVCLLSIVCSNVAGLQFVRSTERQAEFSIRRALGASPLRIARQILVEVLLLTGMGAAAAIWIAEGGVHFLSKYKPMGEPRLEPAAYWFLLAAALLAGFACVLPRSRVRRSLIVGQVAIATTLLLSGGLLLRSLLHLLDTPPGFDARQVLTMEISPPPERYKTNEQRARFLETLLAQIRQTHGVESASVCSNLPFGYGENVNTFQIVGRPPLASPPFAVLNNVMPDYFRTMHIPILRGRPLTEADREKSPNVVVIDETIAKKFFPGEDSLGRQIRMGWGDFTVAGVAGAVKMSGLDTEYRPILYFSSLQFPSLGGTLVVRSTLPDDLLVNTVERLVIEADKDLPVYNVSPMQTWIDHSLQTRQLVVVLVGVFAVSGVLLAALGLYGVLSYLIVLRRREIGIRMALGADSRTIALFVARDGAAMAGAGMLIGILGAFATQRLVASQLYETRPQDAFTWVLVLTVVAASCTLACVLPAWKAMRVNPAELTKSA
jgi:ABC-type antimicrobial peptide transport system permease subunit